MWFMSLRNASYREVLFNKLIWQSIVIDKLNAGSLNTGQLRLRGFGYLMVSRIQQRAAVPVPREETRGCNEGDGAVIGTYFLLLLLPLIKNTNHRLFSRWSRALDKADYDSSIPENIPLLRTRPANVASPPSLLKAICKRGLETQGFHTKWTVGKVTFRSLCLLEDLQAPAQCGSCIRKRPKGRWQTLFFQRSHNQLRKYS